MGGIGIFVLILFILFACFFAFIGIKQMRQVKPVGFFTGEIPPTAEELTDVKTWNKKHGILWIGFAFDTLIAWLPLYFFNDNIIGTALCVVILAVSAIGMVVGHNNLIQIYRK